MARRRLHQGRLDRLLSRRCRVDSAAPRRAAADRAALPQRDPRGFVFREERAARIARVDSYRHGRDRERTAQRNAAFRSATTKPALVYFANLAAIVLHIWTSRAGSLEVPDFAFFDLDPNEGCTLATLAKVALGLRAALNEIGLEPVDQDLGRLGPPRAGPARTGLHLRHRQAVRRAGRPHAQRPDARADHARADAGAAAQGDRLPGLRPSRDGEDLGRPLQRPRPGGGARLVSRWNGPKSRRWAANGPRRRRANSSALQSRTSRDCWPSTETSGPAPGGKNSAWNLRSRKRRKLWR